MRQEFYNKVLPDKGTNYFLSWTNKSQATKKVNDNGEVSYRPRMNEEWVQSKDDIEKKILDIQTKHGKDCNIYHGISTYKTQIRRGYINSELNVEYRRCFYIDLDVDITKHEENKGYDTKANALKALLNFVDTSGFPQPIIIDSGNGIHGYYAFDEDVSILEWKTYAEKFIQVCQDKGLIPDKQVMSDVSRIMRVPGTANVKYLNGAWKEQKCVFLSQDLPTYPFSTFKELLGEVTNLDAILQQAAKLPMTEDEIKAAKLDNFKVKFATLLTKSARGEGCNQLKRIIVDTDPNKVGYDDWFAAISIAGNCADGDTAVHEISKYATSYSAEETDFKRNETLGKPYTCVKFNELEPGICEGCKFKDKVKSPISIFREFVAAPPATIPNASLPVDSEFVGLPKELLPFTYGGASGGIYYKVEPIVDDDGVAHEQPPALVYRHLFYPTRRLFDNEEGELIDWRVVLPSPTNGVIKREFRMPVAVSYDFNKCRDYITKNGITFRADTSEGKYIMKYINEWTNYLIDTVDADQVTTQLGWASNNTSFVLGAEEYKIVNNLLVEGKSALNGNARLVGPHVKKAGSYDKWKAAAQHLDLDGFELHAFVFLTTFGSVLLRYTSTPGMTVCLYNKLSGTAKTGAGFAALSVWGDPFKLYLSGIKKGKKESDNLGASSLSVVERYIALKNITLLYDEIGSQNPEDIAGFIHSIAQGTGKARMKSSVNEERGYKDGASMIALFTSNDSVHRKLMSINANPNGELARLLEFKVEEPPLLRQDPSKGNEIFQTMRDNHGWAGPEYIKHILQMSEDEIKSRIEKWRLKVINDYSGESVYRFYHNTIAATFAAAEIVNEIGIVNFNLEKIYKDIIQKMIHIKNNVVEINKTDYEDLMGRYINHNHNGMLVIEDGTAVGDVRAPHLVIRADLDNKLYNFETRSFEEWLTPKGVNVDDFIDSMNLNGIECRKHKKRLGAGWKGATGINAVSTIEIKTDKFFDDILKEKEKEKENVAVK